MCQAGRAGDGAEQECNHRQFDQGLSIRSPRLDITKTKDQCQDQDAPKEGRRPITGRLAGTDKRVSIATRVLPFR